MDQLLCHKNMDQLPWTGYHEAVIMDQLLCHSYYGSISMDRLRSSYHGSVTCHGYYGSITMTEVGPVCLTGSSGCQAPGGYEAPQQSYTSSGSVVPIVKDDRQGPDADGNYLNSSRLVTASVVRSRAPPWGDWRRGSPRRMGVSSNSDGSPGIFNFVADAAGYKVQSDLLPTPHPLPAHAIADRVRPSARSRRTPTPVRRPSPGYN
ncbi:Cuticle protein [Homarus americanus]|uniref:Cuticle protein n=1 Tax=Homarus americanus TaxID=6706 RepID=A0A8J5MLK3_HOMAM|nr:Cuticle protein [Homarus americanus]